MASSNGDVLNNGQERMGARMRALFELRTQNDSAGRKELVLALKNRNNSTLLRHEVAFALGQMQHSEVIPDLINILEDFEDDVVVRHECAEALGAIGDPISIPVLKMCLSREDEHREVTETCLLAIERLEQVEKDSLNRSNETFSTIDPVEPTSAEMGLPVKELETILLDENQNLGKRYRAMFTLRDINTNESCLSLAKGLFESSSALFRHEVAFVLGQLENSVVFDSLKQSLENLAENDMVRHEAAEALGALDIPEVVPLLVQYSKDESQIVRESCEVALDAKQYWQEFAQSAT